MTTAISRETAARNPFTFCDNQALPTESVSDALHLIGAVHEHGPDDVATILAHLSRQQLYALAVTLAAMVPDTYTPVELLAWNDARYTAPTRQPDTQQPALFPVVLTYHGQPLRPHGTHAAFGRHRSRNEEPCDACWHGERDYQRERARRRRATNRLEATG